VVSFTPRALYPQGKSPWYPVGRRLGGPQSRSGRAGEDKNSHSQQIKLKYLLFSNNEILLILFPFLGKNTVARLVPDALKNLAVITCKEKLQNHCERKKEKER
jgi:hypothetical protein